MAREKGADGLRAGKAVPFQVGDLLPLRSEHTNRAARSFERRLDFPEREAFSSAGAATKQSDKIPRGEDMPDRLTLLGIQRGIRRTIAGTKRGVPSQALLSQANNVPFAGDNLAGGDFAGEPFIPHITALLSDGLNVAQCHFLSSGVFQRVTPKFVLMNDRTPVKQVLFRPPHRHLSGHSWRVRLQ